MGIFILKALIPAFLIFNTLSTNKNYIRLYYGGIVDKPIPEVILYQDTMVTDMYFFGIKKKVPKSNLDNIVKEVLTNPIYTEIDTFRVGYYNIEIYLEEKQSLYAVFDKNSTLIIFKMVCNQMDDLRLKDELKDFFENIATRIY